MVLHQGFLIQLDLETIQLGDSEGMEQQVREEPVPFDQDARGQREPNGRNHGCCG